MNKAAAVYTRELSGKKELNGLVKVPVVKDGFYSSWAQYSILLNREEERDRLQAYLKEKGIPTMVYYPKPMHEQTAFHGMDCVKVDLSVSVELCKRVLALPMHPYLKEEEQRQIVEAIAEKLGR